MGEAVKGATDTLAKTNEYYENAAKVAAAPSLLPVPGTTPTAIPAPATSAAATSASSAPASATGTPVPSATQSGPIEDSMADAQARFDAQYSGAKRGDAYAVTANSSVYLPGAHKDPRRLDTATTGPIVTVGLAVNDIYSWTDTQAQNFSDAAMRAGYLDSPTIDISKLMPIWAKTVETAAGMYSVGKTVDPYTLMRRWADGDAEKTGKASSTTTTDRRYTVTSALTAEQLAHAALSERLGRPATPTEVREFTKALNSAQAKAPDVTTTTTAYDPSGAAKSSTSATQEGLTAEGFALDWSWDHNKDEAKAYQAAGLIMPWLFEALSGPL